jgi:glycine cleavage system H protein
VAEVNEALNTAPEQVNKDANKTWMIKVTLKDAGEANGLLSAADYEKFVAEESGN